MQDIVDDIVQQIALVTDDDHCGAVGFQEIFEPQRRFEIKMVRWLVKQQQVRLREQQSGECDPHFPATGKTVERTLLRVFVKSKADKDFRRPRRGGMGIDRRQPFVDIGDAVHGILIAAAMVQPVFFDKQRGAFEVGFQHGRKRRRCSRRCFLRNIADARVFRHVDAALVGFAATGDQLHQR